MNILGEGFPKEITYQISQRQKIYGAGYNSLRTPDQLVFLNSNTSWCKLVSSVNIDNKQIITNNSLSGLSDIEDNKLATKYVLFNGTSIDNTQQQRFGINQNNSLSGDNNAYGIGGNDFGIRPMMGITSVSVKHENRGSLRRATVQIKAWNKVQFDIIDVLYLRLGFNILLEWGHSMYFDNNGNFQSNPNNSLSTEFLNGQGTYKGKTTSLTYDKFLYLIQEKRLSSNGNYDAMFAKVSNFHWSFSNDGSYDITLYLISVGDVIESFKINTLVQDINYNSSGSNIDISESTDAQIIDTYSNKNYIGQYLYKLKQQLIQNTPTSTTNIQNNNFLGARRDTPDGVMYNREIGGGI